MTEEEIQRLIDLLSSDLKTEKVNDHRLPFEVGQCYFWRLVTYHCIGRVKSIIGHFIVLEQASWVADSGRFSIAIHQGALTEVEAVGDMIINSKMIADAFPWKHAMPTQAK